MKYVYLLSLLLTLTSCGLSPEEQMIHDFRAKEYKESLGLHIKDIKLKINSVEKLEDIKAIDSAKFYKQKLVELWVGDESSLEKYDTLSFSYVVKELEAAHESYQELILLNIELGREYGNWEYEEKRDRYIRAKYDVMHWEKIYNEYMENPEKSLCVKYKANTTALNPILKINQTFDDYYWTNSEQTEIVSSERIEQ